ncbi:MAG: 38, gp56 [Mycobacterium sp.]|jgi:hypothetical protein|nr:38, gp56 [Mycobacterium sp.]
MIEVGTRVRIDRDETTYPAKGTWPQFRGKTGTVVEINDDKYGVVFGKVKERVNRPGTYQWSGDESQTWFKRYEIRVLAPQRALSCLQSLPPIETTGKVLAHV